MKNICSVGIYLPIRNTVLRNLLEIYSRNDHSRNFLPERESRMGKWKGTREIWSGSMGKARELPSWPSRESRFAHARRVYASFETQWLVINERGRSRCEPNGAIAGSSGRSGSGGGSLSNSCLVSLPVSMKLATCVAVKFVNTVPFARLSR